ncbi:MAG: outer membrane protein assembly factor BamE [Cocleimonas sp.]|nr:outer membrane protein assembly factor BamE [Cocleimonas sp.]
MKKLILLIAIIVLSGCSNYKLEVQQGNVVTEDAISMLQQGMSKQTVQSILGTPLLHDSFDTDRWDYLFYHNKKHQKKTSKDLTLFFQNNQLQKIMKK